MEHGIATHLSQPFLTTNLYVFYEVANSYEFERSHSICLDPS